MGPSPLRGAEDSIGLGESEEEVETDHPSRAGHG